LSDEEDWPVTTGEMMLLDAYEMTLVDIKTVELDALHTLSVEVRWPHRAEDWQLLREVGHGVAMCDTIGRLLGTAMWFPYGGAFMTIGMVLTSPRLQMLGAGRWLMKHVMAQAGHRAIGLNATRAARRLYSSLSFTPDATVYQCQGLAVAPEDGPWPADAQLRRPEPDDLAAMVALDTAAFRAGRAELLAHLIGLSRATILQRDGRLVAFALCRPFGRGHVVGPIVAADDEDAIAVVRPHVAEHAGRFLRIDTRQTEGAFPAFLTRSGMAVYDTVTTMSLGRRWVPRDRVAGAPIIYGLTSQALG
jgi:GNAT superfamily N-acetyltransferase